MTGSGNESDANGNTLVGEVPGGAVAPTETFTDEYDYNNRLIKRSNGTATGNTTVTIVYDGDGNRVKKTVAVVGGSTTTTYFVVDTQNPTGYAQVLEEWESTDAEVSWEKTRSYLYGHDLISQERISSGPLTETDYYGYDGHGNVRFLIEPDGTIADTYTYDAFGTLIHQTDADGVAIGTSGTFNITPNRYLYCGEQWDSDLGFYYLRARYLNPDSGRFWTMDTYEGAPDDPLTLHKYLYCHANPVNGHDPSGHEYTMKGQLGVIGTIGLMARIALPAIAKGGLTGAAILSDVGLFLGASTAVYLSADYLLQVTVRDWIDKAKEILRRRLNNTAPLPKVVPIPAALMPNIARNISMYQNTFPGSDILTRVSPYQTAKNRYQMLKQVVKRGGLWTLPPYHSWDEYPFASSVEGGNPALGSIMAVPVHDQSIQGGIIAGSYLIEKITPGQKFVVVVIP